MQSTRPGKSEMELEDVTCESLHPYWTRTNTRLDRTGGGERGQIELKTKGSYWILFDPRSATMGGNKAVLSFFSDLERRNIIAKCSGASPWAPIVVTLPTSTLYWSFSSNHPKSSKNDWGWKFQVLPLRGQSWSKEVEAVGCVPSWIGVAGLSSISRVTVTPSPRSMCTLYSSAKREDQSCRLLQRSLRYQNQTLEHETTQTPTQLKHQHRYDATFLSQGFRSTEKKQSHHTPFTPSTFQ